MEDLESRTIDLELRFMKLEREVHELSDVVAAQQRVIDALRDEAKRRRQHDRLNEEALGDETPPHY
jgi:uncharacterized coiled-coil protein SlyX